MKHLSVLLSIFILLSFTACDSPSMSGKKVHKEYFKGGQLRSEFIMDDSTGQNGLFKEYNYDGNKLSSVGMRNGVKHGTEYMYDAKGRVMRADPYVNGRIHGTRKDFYPNGDVLASIPYQKGVRRGYAFVYNKDGSINKKVMFRNNKMVN